jgi:hypothetical protein
MVIIRVVPSWARPELASGFGAFGNILTVSELPLPGEPPMLLQPAKTIKQHTGKQKIKRINEKFLSKNRGKPLKGKLHITSVAFPISAY